MGALLCGEETQAGLPIKPGNKQTAQATKYARVSKRTLAIIVRDFRDRLGKDPGLYYLVNPPGGVTEEERTDIENEIVYFLSRVHKDPTLDFPTKWLTELREYELTPAEWSAIDQHFQAALTASPLPDPTRASLSNRFARLRAEVIQPD